MHNPHSNEDRMCVNEMESLTSVLPAGFLTEKGEIPVITTDMECIAPYMRQ
jgi:hypothetical protein